MAPFFLNKDEKFKHLKRCFKGLKNTLDPYLDKVEYTSDLDISSISKDIQLFYDEYLQEYPSVKKYFPNVVILLNAIILKINLGNKIFLDLKPFHPLLKEVRDTLKQLNPYNNCSKYQQAILNDMYDLANSQNMTTIKNIIDRTENEFMRLTTDIKKNEKSNRLSLMIGILGIIVSIFMTIFKF